MPSKGKEGYKKLAQRGEDAKNFDWRSDEILELETKWGGIVDFADGKIDGYKLESVLRYGFFRVKAPVFADPFVKMQTLAVLVVIGCVALVFSLCHLSGVMHVDGTLVGMAASSFGYFSGLSSFLFGYVCYSETTIALYWIYDATHSGCSFFNCYIICYQGFLFSIIWRLT